MAKHRLTGSVEDRPRSGGPRKTTARQDRHLIRLARQNRFMSARRLRDRWQGVLRQRVSRQLVNQRLVEAGYRARRPRRRPLLTPMHRKARHRWAEYRQNWNIRTWGRIVWSDESKFNLYNADGRWRVRRLPNEAFRDDCVVGRTQGNGGSVLVWGALSLHGKLDLYVWDQRVTGVAYRDNILLPRVIPHIQGHPQRNLVYMDDNAPAHRARVAQQALGNAGVPRMEWPANSPDLNIIEHAWDILGRAIQNRQQAVTTLPELRRALVEEWNNIPMHKIRTLVASCRRRCQAVVQNRGGYTRY